MSSPLLLTRTDSLPASVAAEITRLDPSQVVILGGAGVVDAGVALAIADLGVGEVIRLAGADRYATAARISEYGYPDGSEGVIIVNGQLAPDALSGSPAAAKLGMPMLLVQTGQVPEATITELQRLGPSAVYVLGGSTVVSPEVIDQVAQVTGADVSRISGVNRYATSAAIAGQFFTDVTQLYLATGTGFADALAAGPLAAMNGSPVVLVSPTGGNDAALGVIRALGATSATVIGGTAAVPGSAVATICLELPNACS